MNHLLKKCDGKSLKIKVHPSLLSAYELCIALPRKCNTDVLSKETLQLISSSITVFIHKKNNDYYLIGGFENVNFDITNIQKYRINVLEKMTDQEILEFCWMNIFCSFLSTIDNKKLGDVYDLFKSSMPEVISKKISQRKIFTQTFFASLTKLRDSTIYKQRKPRSTKHSYKLSVLEEALNLSKGEKNV